jgi:hypothetical protein
MKAATKRQKGARIEREIRDRLIEAGVPTRRVIGSGAFGSYDPRLRGDLQIGVSDDEGPGILVGEVKGRASFNTKQLDGWLRDDDLLILRKDGELNPMVYMPWATFECLVQAYWREHIE